MHVIWYVVFALTILIAIAAKIVFFGGPETPRGMGPKLADVGLLVLTFAVLVVIIAFPFTLAGLWAVFAREMHNSYFRALGLLLLFGLSFVVDFVKSALLQTYAVVEIATGLIIGWGALGTDATAAGSLIQGVALAGSVYAMVTGISDFTQGREDAKKGYSSSRRG